MCKHIRGRFGVVLMFHCMDQVCATRWDWENWPERFKGSRDANEKAFYSHINENVRPEILLVFRVS